MHNTFFKHEITWNKIENTKIIILSHNMLINVCVLSIDDCF